MFYLGGIYGKREIVCYGRLKIYSQLTLLHSERPILSTILAFLSAIGLITRANLHVPIRILLSLVWSGHVLWTYASNDFSNCMTTIKRKKNVTPRILTLSFLCQSQSFLSFFFCCNVSERCRQC